MFNTKLTFNEKAQAGRSNSIFAEEISFGVSDNYVPDWGEIEALREYIANAYDENGVNFTIKKIEDGILIEDESERGIKLQDLVIGNSNSREITYKIGTHGEGFKIGALALARLGKTVFIETIGNTIIFYLEYDEKLKSNILKASVEPNDRPKGSSIYLETDKLEEIKSMFLFLNEDLTKVSDLLYRNTKGKGNQIFVNNLAGQEIHSYFSYSLHKKQKINRDRNIIESPYQDIVLELFRTKDRAVLKEWLKVLAEPGFENSFEYELIRYLMEHPGLKVFRELDFSLVREVAKEMNLHFYDIRLTENIQAAHRFVNSSDYLIFRQSNDVNRFCTKYLKNVHRHEELNYGVQVEGRYHLPLFTDVRTDYPIENFTELYKYFKKTTLLKGVELTGDTLTFDLRNQEKVDFVKGVVAKKNASIQHVMSYLYKLLRAKMVKVEGWELTVEKFDGFEALVFTELPDTFHLKVKSLAVVRELENNLFFKDSKIVSSELVYQLKGEQQYQIDTLYQLKEPIPAIFSYRNMSRDKQLRALSHSLVMNAILKKAKQGELANYSFEVEMMDYVVQASVVSNSDTKVLASTMNDQFRAIFGAKTVVSTDPISDKRAKYNGCTIYKGEGIVERYAKALGVCLSSDVKGANATEEGQIERPLETEWAVYNNHSYRKTVHAALTLQRVLEKIYHLTADYDKKSLSLKALLPYSYYNNLKSESLNGDVVIQGSNFKKVIREYCFEIFDCTHLVKKFDKDNINGYNRGKSIVLLDNATYLGTFFHEYIHLSTNLKDLDSEFEKMLAFVGILASQHKEASEKDLKAFLKDYKKWAGGN